MPAFVREVIPPFHPPSGKLAPLENLLTLINGLGNAPGVRYPEEFRQITASLFRRLYHVRLILRWPTFSSDPYDLQRAQYALEADEGVKECLTAMNLMSTIAVEAVDVHHEEALNVQLLVARILRRYDTAMLQRLNKRFYFLFRFFECRAASVLVCGLLTGLLGRFPRGGVRVWARARMPPATRVALREAAP